MIDAHRETLLTFSQAAKKIPPRRGGRPVHVSTIHRWALAGVRGVALESLLVGGTRMTSLEAMQRFYVALTQGTVPEQAPAATDGHAAATRNLAAKGFK